MSDLQSYEYDLQNNAIPIYPAEGRVLWPEIQQKNTVIVPPKAVLHHTTWPTSIITIINYGVARYGSAEPTPREEEWIHYLADPRTDLGAEVTWTECLFQIGYNMTADVSC